MNVPLHRNWLISIVLIVSGCTKSSDEAIPLEERSFFPLEVGMWKVFEVEEITFNAFGSDTSNYFTRETLSDSILTTAGEVRYLVQRLLSKDSLIWELDSVFTVQRIGSSAVVTENNVPICKLTFPVEAGRSWNGNAFNSKNQELFFYEDVINSGNFSEISSDELIRVILADIPRNLVNQDQRSEVYQLGLGLIVKDYLTLNFCTAGCEDLGTIQSGRILKQSLISYGWD